MKAGILKHQITVQRYTVTNDPYGGEIKAYTDLNTIRAQVKPISAKEINEAGSVNEITHKITVRYTDIIENDIIVFGTRKFEIITIINTDESNKELILISKERIND